MTAAIRAEIAVASRESRHRQTTASKKTCGGRRLESGL